MDSTLVVNGSPLTDAQIEKLSRQTIFFGHQSVGADIVQGVRELMAEDPRLQLKLVHSSDPELVMGPALIDASIGENRKPESKNHAFAAIMAKGIGQRGGIAVFKYCYIDIDASTDVPKMFAAYRQTIDDVKRAYPHLTIVHITVPLTVIEHDWKTQLRVLLGRITDRDLNAKRNQYNKLLKERYSETDPLFDLATVESTRADGSRTVVSAGKEKVYYLAPELTYDGGHLNAIGRRLAAQQFLITIAKVTG